MRSVTTTSILSAVTATIAGAATWWLSPFVTGHLEPWDGPGLFYISALVVGGAAAGAVTNKPLIPVVLGFAVGQTLYMVLAVPGGPLLVIGLLFIGFFSLIAGGSGVLARAVKQLWVARQSKEDIER